MGIGLHTSKGKKMNAIELKGTVTKYTAAASMVLAIQGIATADPLGIHQNDAVKIVFQTDLRTDFNEPGDRFFVKVDKDPLLPNDTTLEGRITRIHPANPYRAASMDMVFTSMQLPDGTRFRIDAVPTPMNDPHLVRGADGRLVAAYKPGDQAGYVLGGTVGGLIVGGIAHRPIAGAFLGAIIGSIAGSVNRRDNANLVVRKGEKMVAVFNQDVAVTNSNPGPSRLHPGWRHREGNISTNFNRQNTPPPPAAPSAYDIKVDGQVLKFDQSKPYSDQGVVMVPLDTVADQLNLVTTVHDNGTITIDGPDSSVQLVQDSTSCRGVASNQALPHKVETKGGVVYVPLSLFARIGSAQVTLNGSSVTA
jgi:hypothetical protein